MNENRPLVGSIPANSELPVPKFVPLCNVSVKSAEMTNAVPLSVTVTLLPASIVFNTSDDPVIEPYSCPVPVCVTVSIPLPPAPVPPAPDALTKAPSEELYTSTWSSCKLPTSLNVGLKGVAFILIFMPLSNSSIFFQCIQQY